MTDEKLKETANAINQAVTLHFQKNHSVTQLKPKDEMPILVTSRVFSKDHCAGLPLRNVLRELNRKNLLHLIPLCGLSEGRTGHGILPRRGIPANRNDLLKRAPPHGGPL